mmetsp:Transcript_76665/g.222590  ORF Transcript_76665/g.222590 Transcript_76665/m.222590 type:complete len:224 (-) Transcript_76665:2125-2796(-)
MRLSSHGLRATATTRSPIAPSKSPVPWKTSNKVSTARVANVEQSLCLCGASSIVPAFGMGSNNALSCANTGLAKSRSSSLSQGALYCCSVSCGAAPKPPRRQRLIGARTRAASSTKEHSRQASYLVHSLANHSSSFKAIAPGTSALKASPHTCEPSNCDNSPDAVSGSRADNVSHASQSTGTTTEVRRLCRKRPGSTLIARSASSPLMWRPCFNSCKLRAAAL